MREKCLERCSGCVAGAYRQARLLDAIMQTLQGGTLNSEVVQPSSHPSPLEVPRILDALKPSGSCRRRDGTDLLRLTV